MEEAELEEFYKPTNRLRRRCQLALERFNEFLLWSGDGAPVFPDEGGLHDQSYEWKTAIECLKSAKRRYDAEEERKQRWLSQTGSEAE